MNLLSQDKDEGRIRPQIAVIGTGKATPGEIMDAWESGRLIARGGAVLLCGGKAGVMEAACRGAREEG